MLHPKKTYLYSGKTLVMLLFLKYTSIFYLCANLLHCIFDKSLRPLRGYSCLVMIIYSFLTNHKFTFLLLSLFIIYILIYASWWSLSLGCGFGHRAMNDIVLVFFAPFFIFSEKPKKWIILTILALAIVNFKFIFSYDSCLYTSVNWDFTEYTSILFGDFK